MMMNDHELLTWVYLHAFAVDIHTGKLFCRGQQDRQLSPDELRRWLLLTGRAINRPCFEAWIKFSPKP